MPNNDVENEFLPVLQMMESVVVETYRESPELTDFQVDKAIEGLIRVYQAEQNGKKPPLLKFGVLDKKVFEDVQAVCKVAAISRTKRAEDAKTLTADEIMACLKRIRSSISLWTKEFGRQGYLNYIVQFIP